MQRSHLLWLLPPLLTLSVAPAAPAGQRPQYGGEIRRIVFAPIVTTDPALASSFEEQEVSRCLHATLIEQDPTGAFVPALAESYRLSSAGTGRATLILRIRPDLTFHDGSPLTSDEARRSLIRLLELRPELVRLAGIPPRQSIEAPDVKTLSIDIDTPDATPLMDFLASPMAAIVKVQRNRTIGAGPFLLEEESDNSLRLSAFSGHYRGRPYLDHVSVTSVVSPSEQRRALESDDWDVIDLPAALDPPGGRSAIRSSGEETVLIRINPDAASVDSDALGRALSTINRRDMVELLLKGRGSPASHLLSTRLFPPLAGFVEDPTPAPSAPSGRELSVTLLYPSHDPDLALAAARLKFELRRFVNLDPVRLPLEELRDRIGDGRYESVLDTTFIRSRALSIELARALGPSEELPPISVTDRAAAVAALLTSGTANRVYLFHRPRRWVVRDDIRGLADTTDGIPTYDDAWRAGS